MLAKYKPAATLIKRTPIAVNTAVPEPPVYGSSESTSAKQDTGKKCKNDDQEESIISSKVIFKIFIIVFLYFLYFVINFLVFHYEISMS